ncbi:hypothetical protein ACLBOM_00755 [Escherichia coli]
MSNACGMYRFVTVPDSFSGFALIRQSHMSWMADNIIPAQKRRHTGIAAARREAKKRRRAK